MTLNLIYKGSDDWFRPVYADPNGTLWKDIDASVKNKPDLCTCVNNAFHGEPLSNMHSMEQYKAVEVNFIPERITW